MQKHILLFLIIALIAGSCSLYCEEGSGKVKSEERQVEAFTQLELDGVGRIYLKQGSQQALRVEADDNLLNILETSVKRGKLRISTNGCVKNYTKLDVFLTVKNLEEIESSGSGKIVGTNTLRSKELFLKNSGSGDIQLDISSQSVELDISGSGQIALSGRSETLDIELSSSGNCQAAKLESNEVKADVSGSGNCMLHVVKSLEAELSGSGKIVYSGSPNRIDTNVTGSGTIEQKQ